MSINWVKGISLNILPHFTHYFNVPSGKHFYNFHFITSFWASFILYCFSYFLEIIMNSISNVQPLKTPCQPKFPLELQFYSYSVIYSLILTKMLISVRIWVLHYIDIRYLWSQVFLDSQLLSIDVMIYLTTLYIFFKKGKTKTILFVCSVPKRYLKLISYGCVDGDCLPR